MKRQESIYLGYACDQIHRILNTETDLEEVTFHYGAGIRYHLNTHILGIRHAKELLYCYLNKESAPCPVEYYLFIGAPISHKGKEGLCGYVMKYLNHPPLPHVSYIFVSANHKCLTILTQNSSEICLESHYLSEGTYDLPSKEQSGVACISLSGECFQRLLSTPKKGRKKGRERSLF